jgi:hypothetical protein
MLPSDWIFDNIITLPLKLTENSKYKWIRIAGFLSLFPLFLLLGFASIIALPVMFVEILWEI